MTDTKQSGQSRGFTSVDGVSALSKIGRHERVFRFRALYDRGKPLAHLDVARGSYQLEVGSSEQHLK